MNWENKRRKAVVWTLLLATFALSISLHFLHNHGLGHLAPQEPLLAASVDYTLDNGGNELCPVIRLLLLQGVFQSDPAEHQYPSETLPVPAEEDVCCELTLHTSSRAPPIC